MSKNYRMNVVLVWVLAGGIVWTASAGAVEQTGAGARVFIDFTNTSNDEALVTGLLPAVQLPTLGGVAVTVNLGMLTRSFTLDADGKAQTPTAYFEIHSTTDGMRFTMSVTGSHFETVFAANGLTNGAFTAQPVMIATDINFNGTDYTASLMGTYSTRKQTGLAAYGIITAPVNKEGKPIVHILRAHATTNPVQAEFAEAIQGTLSLAGLKGAVHCHVAFGDGTPVVRALGKQFTALLQTGITHVYTTNGVYVARVVLSCENDVEVARVFVLVGPGWHVNPYNGLITQVQRNGNGSVTLNYDISHVPGAETCSTLFKDASGKPPPLPPQQPGTNFLPPDPAAPELGLTVQRTFVSVGVYVSHCDIMDASNNVIGHGRTTIALGANGLAPAARSAEAEVQPRDDAPAMITFTSMTGKFVFSSTTPDKVLFGGTLQLPAGYILKNPSENLVNMSMGNVQDVLTLNAKNKLTVPTQNGVITKFRLNAHLKGGVAVGGETGRVSITMNSAGLDVAGFDTEGIMPSVRSDEQGMVAVDRTIQVNMLVGGQGYELLAPVEFQLGGENSFGTISARH